METVSVATLQQRMAEQYPHIFCATPPTADTGRCGFGGCGELIADAAHAPHVLVIVQPIDLALDTVRCPAHAPAEVTG